MEQPHPRKAHGHAVFVGGFDDVVIPDGAAGLGDVLHAGLAGTLHIVAEGEEGIGPAGDAGLGGDPGLFLLLCQHLGLDGEGLLPHAVRQNVLILVGGVDIDGVVPVRAADTLHKLEPQDLGVLPEVPVVGLVAGKTCAVDAALLAGSHADGLAVLHIAHGVGLGILEGDEGHDHVDLGLLGQVLVLRDDVGEQVLVDLEVVAALLEGDAENVLVLLGSGDIVRVDLHHVVVALLLGLQDLQGLVGITGGNDAVGDLVLQVPGGGGVAHIGEGRPVAIRAQAVGAPGTDVGTGDGGELCRLVHEVDFLIHIGEGQAHGSAGRGDVLERSGGGQASGGLELLDQLPGVQRVQKVDVAGLAVEDGDGQVAAVTHKDAGGLLVGVAAVFEFQFVHVSRSFY